MTKKYEQLIANKETLEALSDLHLCIDHFGKQRVCRLRSCTATVYKTNGYNFLVSYNTIVAAIGENGVCYDFLRFVYGYTATSAQHIAKFSHDFNATKIVRYYPI